MKLIDIMLLYKSKYPTGSTKALLFKSIRAI